jgi:hypothetical protein
VPNHSCQEILVNLSAAVSGGTVSESNVVNQQRLVISDYTIYWQYARYSILGQIVDAYLPSFHFLSIYVNALIWFKQGNRK